MINRSNHLPWYVGLCGFLFFSIGFNIVQYEEIKTIKQEKILYKVFFEYLYLKLETIESKQKQDFVY